MSTVITATVAFISGAALAHWFNNWMVGGLIVGWIVGLLMAALAVRLKKT